MASFFFDDYHFPSELYNRETGDFTAPIRTLLDFAPHILSELPKKEKDQKPIHSKAQDSWTNSFLSNSANSYFGSLLTSEKTKAVTEFIIHCSSEYMRSTSEKKREEEQFKRFRDEDKKRRRRENNARWFYNKEEISSSSEEEEEQEKIRKKKLQKEKEKATKKKQEEKQNDGGNQQQVVRTDNSALMKSAVAASILSLSLYSTFQASITFSDISFHNQLELLITQVQSIIQSTEVWIEEHEKMNDKVPNQVRMDLIYIKQLVEDLVRLDPRSNKKAEAAGWGCGALGGLSALGGMALGSTAIATGGAVLAVGGVIVMISAKAQSVGKSKISTRILLENQVREKVKKCQKSAKEREKIIENEFETPNNNNRNNKKAREEAATQVEIEPATGDKRQSRRKLKTEANKQLPSPSTNSPSNSRKREKNMLLSS